MEPFIVREARSQHVRLMLASLAFVAFGAFLFLDPENGGEGPWFVRAVGGFIVAFFGLGVFLSIKRLLRPSVRMVIDDAGVHDRTLGVGVIPWREITDAYVATVEKQDFLCLELRDPGPWLEKLPLLRRSLADPGRAMGFSPFALDFSAVQGDAQAALACIHGRIGKEARSSP